MLSTQKILLIGASGNIGIALCREILLKGGVVAATYNSNFAPLKKIANEFNNKSLNIYKLDVTSEKSCEKLFDKLSNEKFIPDTIIYNSGITRDFPLLGMTSKDWHDVLDVNLTGAFNILKSTVKLMYSKKGGKIFLVSSAAASKGGRGQANYAASKAGLEAMARSLAHETARKDICVNCIAPGVIQSSMTTGLMKKAGNKVLDSILLKREGLPEEIAKFTAHMCSPEINYITGQTFHVDGGLKI